MWRCKTLFALLLFAGTVSVLAAVDDDSRSFEEPSFPPAQELLNSVVSSFPGEPVRIEAQLLSKTRYGDLRKKLNVDILLNWGAREPEARYMIKDAFGRPLESLHIRWRRDGSRSETYRVGETLEEAPLPDLYAQIQETDISWIDLAMAYLWWPNGKTMGAERIRGRFCYVVDLPAPEGEAGHYAGVRLWIDPEIGILLQAAAYDEAGNRVKLLEVRSFKKVRDVWIIQNIDVQSYPARHKTSLRVMQAEPAKSIEQAN